MDVLSVMTDDDQVNAMLAHFFDELAHTLDDFLSVIGRLSS